VIIKDRRKFPNSRTDHFDHFSGNTPALPLTNTEIGRHYDDLRYSAMAKAIALFTEKLKAE
jgi:hypothetical protein